MVDEEPGKPSKQNNTENGTLVESVALVAVLKNCAKNKDLYTGSAVHSAIAPRGLLCASHFVASTLISMYAKCGALVKAKEVFEGLAIRNVVSWNALTAAYTQVGHSKEALNCFERMQFEGHSPDAVTYASILKACANIEALDKGEIVHLDVVTKGLFGSHVVLGNALVDMYASCGAFAKAEKVHEELPVRDGVSWNILITRYAQGDHSKEAIACFEQMQYEGLFPDAVTFVGILKACGSIRALGKGKTIHSEALRQGLLNNNAILGNAVVDLYAKCGALVKAKEAFDSLPIVNVSTWNALIAGYVEEGDNIEAGNCFELMQHEGLSPNEVTFASILTAFGNIGALERGKILHSEIDKQQLLGKNIVLGNALIDMYAKCGAFLKAKEVLQGLLVRDAGSWNALIAGYVQENCGTHAMDCFEEMQCDGISPSAYTFACILRACGTVGALGTGETIHLEVTRRGLLSCYALLGNALVDMYVKCGKLTKAKEVLEGLSFRDVVSWSTLIAGYVLEEKGQEALNCFESMQHDGLSPTVVTYICILKAFGTIAALDKGEYIHSEIIQHNLLAGHAELGGALVDMYIKCGALAKSEEVFDELAFRNVVCWSALISGYAEGDHGKEALNCFERMQCEGLSANSVTLICVLKACGSAQALRKGECIHSEILRQGLLGGNVALGNALMTMYVKCGALDKARKVLEGLHSLDVVSWSVLIAGYADGQQGREALNCFTEMQCEGVFPNMVTYTSILKACGNIGALEKGENVHSDIMHQGLFNGNLELGNALVDMYAKCGMLCKAKDVLDSLLVHDVVSWNALISGYAQGEYVKEALHCFEWMQHEGLFPDDVTFLCVLIACSHSGLVEEGQRYFKKMNRDYDIIPNSEHQACMVNLLGRAGLLNYSAAIVKKMPSYHGSPVWLALLSACNNWGNMQLGRWAFECT